ncbi:hypothetical protein [Sulfurovum mangrovi]|uniref:hypothetical protein n=1 Tax=Sulfurovum mangrovi TaxID=2893889 RepID=UPI001E38B566|nr:hypothetical protein [Sulfurovum mangrovi]UFH59857.1 hypothetical protein LN246_03190 [Sulfurovum mangrovi]UFH59908.1 hypothetical protein LN246_03450 [Sulfurovum mangrovi]
MKTKVTFYLSKKFQLERAFNGLNAEKEQEIEIEITDKRLLEFLKIDEHGNATLKIGKPGVCGNNNPKIVPVKHSKKEVYIGDRIAIYADNSGIKKVSEYKEFIGTFYETDGYIFNVIPDEKFLVDLLIKEDETDLSEAIKEEKAALEKINEQTEIAFKKIQTEKKEAEEQRKREKKEKAEKALFEQKNIECELSSFSNRFGSELLKRRMNEGYEWIELAEEEFIDFVSEKIGERSDTEEWYSHERGGSDDDYPSAEQLNLLDCANTEIGEINKLTGFKYITITAHTSIWDAGDENNTVEVKGVEVGLLGRKLFFAA